MVAGREDCISASRLTLFVLPSTCTATTSSLLDSTGFVRLWLRNTQPDTASNATELHDLMPLIPDKFSQTVKTGIHTRRRLCKIPELRRKFAVSVTSNILGPVLTVTLPQFQSDYFTRRQLPEPAPSTCLFTWSSSSSSSPFTMSYKKKRFKIQLSGWQWVVLMNFVVLVLIEP